MEQTKKQIEDSFNIIEHRIANSGKLALTDRKKELELIDIAVAQLESELDRFQLLAFTKYSNEIDEYEERLNTIKFKLRKMNEEEITASQVIEEVKDDAVVEQVIEDATKKQIAETNAKLKEGKERVLGMLKTVNNMKEELNLIDDEIMLQREKMVAIKEKMKQTQNVVFQTKKIVNKLAKSLSEDLFMKVMIWLIFVSLLVVVGLIIGIKFTQNRIRNNKHDKELEKFSQSDFQDIDEDMFVGLEKDTLAELNKLTEADLIHLANEKSTTRIKAEDQIKVDDGVNLNTDSKFDRGSSANPVEKTQSLGTAKPSSSEQKLPPSVPAIESNPNPVPEASKSRLLK